MLLLRRLVVLMMVLGLASAVFAEDESSEPAEKAKQTPARGQVVKVGEGQLLIAIKGKKGDAAIEKAFAIPTGAAVRLERKKARLEDVKPGMSVSLAIDDAGAVKSVTATYPRLVGTFVRLEEGAIVLSMKEEKAEREVTVPVAADAKVQVDKEKGASLGDLKAGLRVTVPQTGEPVDSVMAKSPSAGKPAKKGSSSDEGGVQ